MKYPLILVLLLIFNLLSCNISNHNKFKNNVISSGHPLASLAGKEIFEKGGNAADAAIAAAFALSVVEPSMSGLGGRLQAIYRNKNGFIGGIDASTEVPLNYDKSIDHKNYGYKTIGIPGVVAGLMKLHKEQGSLTLETIMEPSIRYAEKGFKILPGESLRHKSEIKKILEFEGTKFHFLKNNLNNYNPGEVFIQKDLAILLKRISKKGHKGFYEGETARFIVNDIIKNGGYLSMKDLKNYKALDSKVLIGKFNDYKIYSLFLPSYGALTIQILQIMDQFKDLNNEEKWSVLIGKSTKLSHSYRHFQENKDSLVNILSYEKAKNDALMLSNNNFFKKEKTEVSEISAEKIGHTTHLATADKYGNVVSLTQTIGPSMGSKVATKGLGFLYAVTSGSYLGMYEPGKRVHSFISPTLIGNNKKIILALGGAGGNKIVTSIAQVASRYFQQNKSLKDALFYPRVYPDSDTLLIENHIELNNIRLKLDSKNDLNLKFIKEKARFGRIHAVALDTINNSWIGGADPDWEGSVEILKN